MADPGFDSYKLLVEHTQKLSERRQAATQTYLAINTAIFTVLAFLSKDAQFRGWGLVLAGTPLFVMGLRVCRIWYLIISNFRELDRWRYERLHKLEEAFPDEARHFKKEFEELFARPNFGFSNLEVELPKLFGWIYGLYAVGILFATMVGFV